VAGLFYPKDAPDCRRLFERCLAAAKPSPAATSARSFCPHAGLSLTLDRWPRTLQAPAGREYETVVVMGPSHYASLSALGY